MGLLDSLSGGGLLPFMSALDQPPVQPYPPFSQLWNPVGQLMTPADPNMKQALTAYGQGLINPPQPPPAMPPPQDVPGRAFAQAAPQQPPPPMAAPPANVGAQPPSQPLFPGVGATGLSGFFRNLAGQLNPQIYQRNLQEQTAQSTYEALRARGVPDDQARGMALNPAFLQSQFPDFGQLEAQRHNLATEQQAATTPVTIGMDSAGREIKGVRDPSSPTGWRVIDVGGATGEKDDDPSTWSALRRNRAEKIANYEADLRTLPPREFIRDQALSDAATIRPDFDQRNFASSQAGLTRFTSGPQGNSVRSFNVATEHLTQLAQLGAALQNPSDIQTLNAIRNKFRAEFGYEAPTNFDALKAIVGQEIVKSIVPGGGGEPERDKATKQLNSSSNMAQLLGVINTYKGAMGAQLSGLKRQYEQSTLRKDFDRLLSPEAQAQMAAHSSGGAAPAGAAAAAPGVIRYDAQGNRIQ